MQNILVAILCSSFVVVLCGCGGGSDDTVASSNTTTVSPTVTPVAPAAKKSGNSGDKEEISPEEQMQRMMEQDGNRGGGGDGMSAEEEMQRMMEEQQMNESERDGESEMDSQEEMQRMMMEEAAREEREMRQGESGMSAEDEMRMMMEEQARENGGEGSTEEMMRQQMEMESGRGYDGGPQVETPKTFKAKSDLAFKQGHDKEAFQYLYAHYLTSPEGAADHKLHLVVGLKAPRTVMRWGFAVNYTAPKGLSVPPPVIGEKPNVTPEDLRNRSRGGGEQYGGGMMEGGGFSAKPPSTPIGQMDYYTANIGRGLLTGIDSRRTEKAAYGAAVAEVPFEMPKMVKNSGGYGEMEGMMDEMEMYGGRAPRKIFLSEADQLLPGVIFVGNGPSKDMLKVAKTRDVDLLVVVDVRVSYNQRSGLISNTSNVNAYDAVSGEKLFKSSTLMNTSHWQAMEKDKDTIADMIDKFFARLVEEKGYQASAMPKLTPDQAFKRVKSLLEEEYENPLPVLAEVNYYYQSDEKLLADNAYNAAVGRLIGQENAAMFVGGTPEQKAQAISKWLPSNWVDGLESFGADESLVSTSAKTPEASKETVIDDSLKATRKQGIAVFSTKIRPVFIKSCYHCHSANARKLKGEFKVDTFEDLVKGGTSGPAVVPGKPDESLMMKALHYDGELKMPPRQKLSEDELASFKEWIELGAPIP